MGETLVELRARPSAPRTYRAGARPRSLGRRPLTSAERAELREDERALRKAGIARPRTFGQCQPGPCPWVSCRYHLYLDVDQVTGALKLVFPHLEVWQLAETCALRAAARGGLSLEQVGRLTNRSQEGVSKIEEPALAKIRPWAVAELQGEHSPGAPGIDIETRPARRLTSALRGGEDGAGGVSLEQRHLLESAGGRRATRVPAFARLPRRALRLHPGSMVPGGDRSNPPASRKSTSEALVEVGAFLKTRKS
jgi:hypothetical protein